MEASNKPLHLNFGAVKHPGCNYKLYLKLLNMAVMRNIEIKLRRTLTL
jgi:hypothetical protein